MAGRLPISLYFSVSRRWLQIRFTSLICSSDSFFVCLFVLYVCMYWLIAVLVLHWCPGFSLVAESKGLLSSCGTQASLVVASLIAWTSVVASSSQTLEHRLSSCGTMAQLPQGMWNLPGAWMEPMSPLLAGGSLSLIHQGSRAVVILKVQCAQVTSG